MTEIELRKDELAKYPFTNEALEYVREKGITIEQLSSPDNVYLLERAIERIKEAISGKGIRTNWQHDEIEILSFPIAIALVAAIGNPSLSKRYAEAEAKRVSKLLKNDVRKLDLIPHIGRHTFGWDIKLEPDSKNLVLSVFDYLKNATAFHDKSWKLVNRTVKGGYISISPQKAIRLLEEEVKRKIERKLEESARVELPPEVLEKLRLEGLLATAQIPAREEKIGFVIEALPPCIRYLYDEINSGKRLSHIERFTLTSFLLNVGMSIYEIVGLFARTPDFDEVITRYQVEHIAGMRGSGTRYSSPSCKTLSTYGICRNKDELCEPVTHPLAYYKARLASLHSAKEQ